MRPTGRLRYFLRDILCWCLPPSLPSSTASVSAYWPILITLFPSFLSLSLSLLLFLATGFSLLSTWFLSFIISFFSSLNIECHSGGISTLGRLIPISSICITAASWNFLFFALFSLPSIVTSSQKPSVCFQLHE
jgi:hypothetical protein